MSVKAGTSCANRCSPASVGETLRVVRFQQANAHLRFQLAQGVSQRRRGGRYAVCRADHQRQRAAQTAEVRCGNLLPGADTVFASNAARLDEQRGLLWGTRRTFSPAAKRAPTASMR